MELRIDEAGMIWNFSPKVVGILHPMELDNFSDRVYSMEAYLITLMGSDILSSESHYIPSLKFGDSYCYLRPR